MSMQDEIRRADQKLLHVYSRFPVVFDHGQGVYLYDTDGKAYLDFGSGIGVSGLGYGVKAYQDALKNQIDKLTHTSNLYYHMPMIEAAEKITRLSGMDRVFFTNSGAEAIEGAIKTAKKYAYLRDKRAGHEIVAMQHSFHGRTVGSLSVTGTTHYREPFYPLMDGVHFADFNDFSTVKRAVDDNTCAILLEPVQGEGGIYPADPEFLRQVRALCDEKDILLIFDEVQCGMGRTGAFFTWQKYGIKPDILASAKALGCGVPVGAFLTTEKVAENSLEPGDHGTTYGGNPLVCTAVSTVCDLMEEFKIPEHVEKTTPYFEAKLDELCFAHDSLMGHRGMGFMQGLLLKPSIPVGNVVSRALEKGLIVLSAAGNVIRLLPPLVIEEGEIDQAMTILGSVLSEFEK
jgi:acetylornithine/N-succinyldiaminopimelate aminotransferase